MKNLIYKIAGVLGLVFAIFQLGKRNGKTTLKNEITQKTLKDVENSKRIEKKINNMSRDDKLDILHGKK